MAENASLPFQGRVAVITGSSRGIGRAIAETLAQRGANVAIADIQDQLAAATAKEIADQYGCKTLPLKVDVSNFDSANAMIERATSEFGKVDILVNNAGVTRDTLIMRMTEADWDFVIDINLKGAFNCSKAVVRAMMKQRSGRIVNVSSVSGIIGQEGQANYSASKAGLIGFTKALAREVATRNITVNAVAPGLILTDLTKDLPDEWKETYIKMTPMRRMGVPQDIANAVAFLASDDASYITGHVLTVDGGMVMM